MTSWDGWLRPRIPTTGSSEYQHDVMGNMVKNISPKGAETRYTYDKHDELISETSPDGSVTKYVVT